MKSPSDTPHGIDFQDKVISESLFFKISFNQKHMEEINSKASVSEGEPLIPRLLSSSFPFLYHRHSGHVRSQQSHISDSIKGHLSVLCVINIYYKPSESVHPVRPGTHQHSRPAAFQREVMSPPPGNVGSALELVKQLQKGIGSERKTPPNGLRAAAKWK